MTTGSLSGGVCYETAALAVDAYYSAMPVTSVLSSSTLYETSYKSVAGVWRQIEIKTTSAGVKSTMFDVVAPVPTFPDCYSPNESFADGVNIGWAVAGVLSLVLFVRIIKTLIAAIHV